MILIASQLQNYELIYHEDTEEIQRITMEIAHITMNDLDLKQNAHHAYHAWIFAKLLLVNLCLFMCHI